LGPGRPWWPRRTDDDVTDFDLVIWEGVGNCPLSPLLRKQVMANKKDKSKRMNKKEWMKLENPKEIKKNE
jgi:hypothetical protein